MQLAVIHQEIDPDKMNDPIKIEKYSNQEFIGKGDSALSYYHSGRLITVGHSNNYNEITITSNQLQSLNLDDSMFDKFICREKDKPKINQTLSNQSTMLNEYDWRLITDLPIRNIQKIVTVDYTGTMDRYGNYQSLPIKNGMLVLYDVGKLGYYDWNLNSLVKKTKTEANNGDGHLLYNHEYFYPYIKDNNIIDVQSDFGTTVVTTMREGKKVHKLFRSYSTELPTEAKSEIANSRILGKLYNNVSALCGKNLYQKERDYINLDKEYTNFQCLKGEIYDFNNMKKCNKNEGTCTLDIDFVIPSIQSKDKLIAIKEVLNGYLLIQIGGETEVTYNKWMVDFGMATAIPESISRKPTFDFKR